jgi:hypothetical protein
MSKNLLRIGHLIDAFFDMNRTHYYDGIKSLEDDTITSNYILTYKHINQHMFPFSRIYAFHSLSILKKNMYRLYRLATFPRGENPIPYWSKIVKKEHLDLLHNYFAWTALGAIMLKNLSKIPLCISIGEDEVQLTKEEFQKRNQDEVFSSIFEEANTILTSL